MSAPNNIPNSFGVRTRVVTEDQLREMIHLRENNYTLEAIAQQFYVTPSCVGAWMRQAGVNRKYIRPPVVLNEDALKQAVFLCHKMGMSHRQAARVLGVANSTVQYRLARARLLSERQSNLTFKQTVDTVCS